MEMATVVRRMSAPLALLTLGALTTAPAHAAVPIVFELTGTFDEGVLVSYLGANGEPQVATVGLPWSTAFDYNGNARSLTFTGSHPGKGSGSVTCKVTVDGRTIVSHTDNVPAGNVTGATCNIVNLGSGYIGN